MLKITLLCQFQERNIGFRKICLTCSSYPGLGASSRGAGGQGSKPQPRHTIDVKTGRFALLSLSLGINELGNRLGGSESV